MVDKLISAVKDGLVEAISTKVPVNEKNKKYALWIVIVSGIALILGFVYLSKKSKTRGQDPGIPESEESAETDG